MNETQKFLLARKAQLETKIKEVTAPLQAELSQVIAGLNAFGHVDLFSKGADLFVTPDSSAKTVPQQIMAVMNAHPNGILSKDITDKVNSIYKRTLSRGNTSAYLSNLKKGGIADFDLNGLWRPKKEAPVKEASIFD